MMTADQFNSHSLNYLPGHLALRVTHTGIGEAHGEISIKEIHYAPNGYLHAGTVVTLADSCSGAGCMANLPEGASGFTTIELKSNHLSTAKEGVIECVAKAVHTGRNTQVWDATVTHRETGKAIALFRCTQMILYPKNS
jgi:1,4-dihydroxy-2-naphthoyl-CoA hydrolase